VKKWDVDFHGGIIGEDVSVDMEAHARVEAETQDQATKDGLKKVQELNIFFEDQDVEWEHVRTTEWTCTCNTTTSVECPEHGDTDGGDIGPRTCHRCGNKTRREAVDGVVTCSDCA